MAVPKVKPSRKQAEHQPVGFTLVEMMIVAAVILVAAAIALPKATIAMRIARLTGAAQDFRGLLQSARIYAIRDNRFYSTYILTASANQAEECYVDMLPKSATGASGNGGASVVQGDPLITIPSEVTQMSAANAPGTSNLRSQLLPAATSVNPTDASVTPITFGPSGMPCLVVQVTGGSVCNTLGGPVAFWTFFQDAITRNWEAVTVTPAGRIQAWSYTGTAWTEQ